MIVRSPGRNGKTGKSRSVGRGSREATPDDDIAGLMRRAFSLTVGTTKTVQGLVDRIDGMIGNGDLAPSERLVESDLCERFGVTRSPLREALRILAGDGVIELVANRGARVRRLNIKELQDRSRAVAGIYCNGMELFVVQTSEPFDTGMKLLRHMTPLIAGPSRIHDAAGLLTLMTQYHTVVNHFCGNEFLNQLVSRIHVRHFLRQLADSMPYQELFHAAKQYEDVTEALANRESRAAIDIVKRTGVVYLQV